ncbi:YkgJ family cysteine cluster protein [Chlamydiales bacterium]|nr:YkgJ family cysteine cluster protein [Chlamydiales bacterium]
MTWYQKGLNFKCTECGGCCTGAPGYIYLTINEMEEIATDLNMPFETFTQKYIRKVGDRYSLIETGSQFDCVFLKNKRCSIYPVRPKQCRTFPFWQTNLKTRQHWEEAKQLCEGISDEAPLITIEEIKERMQ